MEEVVWRDVTPNQHVHLWRLLRLLDTRAYALWHVRCVVCGIEEIVGQSELRYPRVMRAFSWKVGRRLRSVTA